MTISMEVKLQEAIKKVLEEERVYETIYIAIKPSGTLIIDTRPDKIIPDSKDTRTLEQFQKEGLL